MSLLDVSTGQRWSQWPKANAQYKWASPAASLLSYQLLCSCAPRSAPRPSKPWYAPVLSTVEANPRAGLPLPGQLLQICSVPISLSLFLGFVLTMLDRVHTKPDQEQTLMSLIQLESVIRLLGDRFRTGREGPIRAEEELLRRIVSVPTAFPGPLYWMWGKLGALENHRYRILVVVNKEAQGTPSRESGRAASSYIIESPVPGTPVSWANEWP